MLSMRHAPWPQQRENASDLLPEDRRPRITVIGVGDTGSRMLSLLLHTPVAGVTRLTSYQKDWCPHSYPGLSWPSLGTSQTSGLKPVAGLVDRQRMPTTGEAPLRKLLADTDMVFITVGMDDALGLQGVSVIARNARMFDCLTIVMALPPVIEIDAPCTGQAQPHRHRLSVHIDALITMPSRYGRQGRQRSMLGWAAGGLAHAMIRQTV